MRPHSALVAAWLAVLAGFAVTAVLAATNDTFPADTWLAHRVQEIDSDVFARALDWAEDLTDLPLFAVVCVLLSMALFVFGDRFGALLVLVSSAGRLLNSLALKEIIERPRPSGDIVRFEDQPTSFSFPSGHAEAAFVLYGLIFYFAALYIRDPRLRLPLQIACAAIIVLTGIERVYAGHHWPSDVLGGYYLGALVLAALIAVHKLALKLPVNRPLFRSFSRSTTASNPE